MPHGGRKMKYKPYKIKKGSRFTIFPPASQTAAPAPPHYYGDRDSKVRMWGNTS